MDQEPIPDSVESSAPPVQPPDDYRPPEAMHYIPMPPLIKLFMLVVVVSLGLAVFRLPGAIEAPVEFVRGKAALEKNDPQAAVGHFEKVAKAFPDDIDVQIALATAYYQGGQLEQSAHVLDSLNGRQVNGEQNGKLTELSDKIEAQGEAQGKFMQQHENGGGQR